MDIRIQSQGFTLTPTIGARVHEQLGKALDRYADKIVSVDAFLKDDAGSKGPDEKTALVRVQLRHRAPVMIETTTRDLYKAIDATARRSRRAVRRAVGRRERHLSGHSRRLRLFSTLAADS